MSVGLGVEQVLIVVEIARTGDLWAWIVIAVIIIASFAAFLSMLRSVSLTQAA